MTMPLPDNFDAAAFDRAQGGDDDEARAKEAMAYAVAELAKMEAIRTILRKAREDIEGLGPVGEWPSDYSLDNLMFDLSALCIWDAARVRERLFINKMEELEART